MVGCSADGDLNEEKYTQPLPWIGLYVAAASLACAIAMAADFIHSCRHKKFWFPNKFFSINATSLTVVAVAVKLSVDLNTPMPSRIDQLSKLSSGVLVCVVIANSMPSLGTVQNKEIMMNIMAFAILVVTVLVNIAIQLGTEVIYVCWWEHVGVMSLMLVMLLILGSSALAVATTKTELEFMYKKKCDMAMQEGSKDMNRRTPEELKEDLMKFWIMAHTSNPQFVMGRSVTCAASGALCLLGTTVLAEAMLRSFFMPGSFKFCAGESDYQWSTTLVLVAQALAVGVGSVAPAVRWFTESQQLRKLAHEAKRSCLDTIIRAQIGIVMGCKLIQFISIFCACIIVKVCDSCSKLKKLLPSESISADQSMETKNLDLSRFVLHFEGEEELVEVTMRKNCTATDNWMREGEKKQPKHLTDLLKKATFAEGFKGVREFDCDQVCILDCEEPPQPWSLPIVTLTAIAISLPNISSCSIKQLLCSVPKSTREVLELLVEGGKSRLAEFKNAYPTECPRINPSEWHAEALAANSMYRISSTILKNYQHYNMAPGESLFPSLVVLISDLLAACLTNLRPFIFSKCLKTTIEERKGSVREAVYILGQMVEIVKLLDQSSLSIVYSDKITTIADWRSLHKAIKPLAIAPHPTMADTASINAGEKYLNIS
ncbi:unnamed protein product [Linum tenue]|uniref:Uncharacterized protein n=1 Tax=Linum tenue TaxID=586396 RepID=A0AAV0K797_9ROSI|nr:unnamed protein product [Linum tenue]